MLYETITAAEKKHNKNNIKNIYIDINHMDGLVILK